MARKNGNTTKNSRPQAQKPGKVRQIQELRRSGAAGLHDHRRPRRRDWTGED